ncbi:MAG: Xaa-Pro peptidase family protein [Eubacteriales bacterium]|nr:Xaa-Pro peptidase family protein [Eubacteriales bacterium]
MNEIQKTCFELRKAGVDVAVLTSVENVTYVSGVGVSSHFGTVDCLGKGMPLAIIMLDVQKESALVLAIEDFKAQMEQECMILSRKYFTIFGNLKQVEVVKEFKEMLKVALKDIGLQSYQKINIGIEYQSCPFLICDVIAGYAANSHFCNITDALENARRIKTDREIAVLRKNAKILDAGQNVFNAMMSNASQLSEFELYQALTGAMIFEAGMLIPFSGELVSGSRICEIKWPGGPVSREILPGDMALLDISPRYKGYWGDCSNVAVFGQPNQKQLKYFNTVIDTFNVVCDMLRPGVKCNDVVAAIIDSYGKNGFKIPHYCGHQIGTSVNELPRFVPFDTSAVEENMVFCLELGLYEGAGGDTGIRCEKMILINQNGCEVLNQFQWGI